MLTLLAIVLSFAAGYMIGCRKYRSHAAGADAISKSMLAVALHLAAKRPGEQRRLKTF